MNRTRLIPALVATLLASAASAQFGVTPSTSNDRSPEPTSIRRVDGSALARRYLERYAPVLRQDTADHDGDHGTQDWITAVDFDGDWHLDNSWESQGEKAGKRRAHPHRAVVYTAASLTSTHAFLVYAWFHPRDWGRGLAENHGLRTFLGKISFGKIPHSAHENDLEGALLVVDRQREEVVVVETVFHRIFQKYWRDPEVHPRGSVEGEGWNGSFRVDEEGRPILMAESHGHGVQAWDGKPFPGRHDDGVVYFPGAEAGDPEDFEDMGEAARFAEDRGGRVREVPYEMVPIAAELLPRARARDAFVFGKFGRPGKYLAEEIGMSFRGDDYGANKANLPWAWTDESTDVPAGQFFFDPAGMVADHFEFPEGFGREYLAHPLTEGPAS